MSLRSIGCMFAAWDMGVLAEDSTMYSLFFDPNGVWGGLFSKELILCEVPCIIRVSLIILLYFERVMFYLFVFGFRVYQMVYRRNHVLDIL